MQWILPSVNFTPSILFICACWLFTVASSSEGQSEYSDKRCKCICPPGNQTDRAVYITNVSPERCNCDNVVLPHLRYYEFASEFCARCQCKHESRNSWTIKIVVIGFIAITGVLFVYMIYLLIEARFFKGNKALAEDTNVAYEQHLDEEVNLLLGSASDFKEYRGAAAVETQVHRRKSFGSKFQEQMARWKRAVMQQRGNVYVRRTVLNN